MYSYFAWADHLLHKLLLAFHRRDRHTVVNQDMEMRYRTRVKSESSIESTNFNEIFSVKKSFCSPVAKTKFYRLEKKLHIILVEIHLLNEEACSNICEISVKNLLKS